MGNGRQCQSHFLLSVFNGSHEKYPALLFGYEAHLVTLLDAIKQLLVRHLNTMVMAGMSRLARGPCRSVTLPGFIQERVQSLEP